MRVESSRMCVSKESCSKFDTLGVVQVDQRVFWKIVKWFIQNVEKKTCQTELVEGSR